MRILAFDTSSEACSAALWDSSSTMNDQIKTRHQIAPMQQARLILPMIQALLSSSSLQLNKLDAIAYGCGPGSFTGMRIASSVVQGIGVAEGLPILQISSLAAMAQAAFMKHQWDKLLVAVDARMEQIYWAIYEVNQAGLVELIGAEQVLKPDELFQSNHELSSGKWYGIGDGWKKYEEKLVKQLGFSPCNIDYTALPEASAMLGLAKKQLDDGNQVAISQALPVYLR